MPHRSDAARGNTKPNRAKDGKKSENKSKTRSGRAGSCLLLLLGSSGTLLYFSILSISLCNLELRVPPPESLSGKTASLV